MPQALFVVGAASGVYLMTVHPDTALPVYVVEHAGTVLGVGPAFAAVTAVAIKEGLCYGKGEAAALALVRRFAARYLLCLLLPSVMPSHKHCGRKCFLL